MEQLSLLIFLGVWSLVLFIVAGSFMIVIRLIAFCMGRLSMRTEKNKAISRYCVKAYKRM